jgi:DNA invertase Pin-like site-specific DNA recombinase
MKAIAYLRVSGKTQVKGSGLDRQLDKIMDFAKEQGFEIVSSFSEEGISGTKSYEDRPAFQGAISFCLSNDVNCLLVEGLHRLAREYAVQEQLLFYLAAKGVDLISVDTGENITKAMSEDPMKKAIIQIQGVFAELDKNLLVAKLRKGKEKKRQENKKNGRISLSGEGKCGGPPSLFDKYPDIRDKIFELKYGKKFTLREISKHLFYHGYTTRNDTPISIKQISTIVNGKEKQKSRRT